MKKTYLDANKKTVKTFRKKKPIESIEKIIARNRQKIFDDWKRKNTKQKGKRL